MIIPSSKRCALEKDGFRANFLVCIPSNVNQASPSMLSVIKVYGHAETNGFITEDISAGEQSG